MKLIIIFIFLLSIGDSDACAQKNIEYCFDQPVNDSLIAGLNYWAKLYKKPVKKLNVYALVVAEDRDIEIFLVEFSHLPKKGILELIKKSKRVIQISDRIFLPVLIPADNFSKEVKNAKVTGIPHTGFYLKIEYDNYKQKVVKTAFYF